MESGGGVGDGGGGGGGATTSLEDSNAPGTHETNTASQGSGNPGRDSPALRVRPLLTPPAAWVLAEGRGSHSSILQLNLSRF
jgi:hypothetical protein